jgi:hypothetical protein
MRTPTPLTIILTINNNKIILAAILAARIMAANIALQAWPKILAMEW